MPSGKLRSQEQQNNTKTTQDANERKRMPSLLDDDRKAHFHGDGTETHLVVAGLVMKFADNGSGQSRRLVARPELRFENQVPRKHGERIGSDLDLLRFRVHDRLSRYRTGRPGELKRNQKFIFRLIAVDVKAGLDGDRELVGKLLAPLHCYLGRWFNGEPLLRLRPGGDCQGGKRGYQSAASRQEGSGFH